MLYRCRQFEAPGCPPPDPEEDSVPGIVLTFPILAGKVEAWRRFCQELAGSRSILYEASRRRLGITCEQMALLETAFGAT